MLGQETKVFLAAYCIDRVSALGDRTMLIRTTVDPAIHCALGTGGDRGLNADVDCSGLAAETTILVGSLRVPGWFPCRNRRCR